VLQQFGAPKLHATFGRGRIPRIAVIRAYDVWSNLSRRFVVDNEKPNSVGPDLLLSARNLPPKSNGHQRVRGKIYLLTYSTAGDGGVQTGQSIVANQEDLESRQPDEARRREDTDDVVLQVQMTQRQVRRR